MPSDRAWALALAELLGPSLTLLKDGIDQAAPFFSEPALESDALAQLEVDGARPALQALISLLDNDPWDGLDQDRGKELLVPQSKKPASRKECS